MLYTPLARGTRLGPEDTMCSDFATRLRVATLEGRLRAVWTHPANELAFSFRKSPRAAIAKALGLITGATDYLFMWGNGSAALEAKSRLGGLSSDQRDFRTWCAAHGVPHHVFRTADEGEAILQQLGVLDL